MGFRTVVVADRAEWFVGPGHIVRACAPSFLRCGDAPFAAHERIMRYANVVYPAEAGRREARRCRQAIRYRPCGCVGREREAVTCKQARGLTRTIRHPFLQTLVEVAGAAARVGAMYVVPVLA